MVRGRLEMVAALGLADRIVGIEAYTRYPPEVLKKPLVGGRLGFSVDEVVAQRPDLVVVTPSRWSRDRLIDRGFAEPGVRVVRHGVDRDLYSPMAAAERQANRKAIGIADDETVFLNVGLPAWNKGIDLLVHAFAIARRAQPRCRLILKDAQKLYGLGAEQVLRDLAAQQPSLVTADVIGAISVVGGNMSLAELRLLFGVADCYVSPYRAEGFNLPVLEALACGTPVIVSSGGATDDFCHGPAVFKVPSIFKRAVVRDHPGACLLEPRTGSVFWPTLKTCR